MRYRLLLVCMCMLPTIAYGQRAPNANVNGIGQLPYEGSEIYRFLLHKQGLEPHKTVADALNNPAETVIIIQGDPPLLNDFHRLNGRTIRSFLEWGGAILIAGDERSDNRPGSWADTFGIFRDGRHLTADQDSCYRRIAGRPLVRPFKALDPLLVNPNSPQLIFNDIERTGTKALATDLASAMYLRGPRPFGYNRLPLASYPVSTEYLDQGFGQPKLQFEGCYFAVGYWAEQGTGRMLVLADHSVFVNGMMGFVPDNNAEGGFTTDNGNVEFTKRAITWLQQGGPNPRTKCLFIEDGQIIDRFAVQVQNTPPPNPPFPPLTPEMMTALANAALNASNEMAQKAEERDLFNSIFRRIGIQRVLRFFLAVVSVLFVWLLLRRLVRSYWSTPAAAKLHPRMAESLLPHGGVIKQRLDAQLDVNNFYEAARTRIQDRFNRLGGQPTSDGTMPPVLIANDGPDGADLSRTIRGLWLIGYGVKPVYVGPGEWDAMNQDLERTMKRASRGEWTFGQEIV